MEDNHNIIIYKIQNAYMLPYEAVIDKDIMSYYDKNNEIIASSRIYLICKVRKKGIFFKRFLEPEVLYVGETFNKANRFSSHQQLLQATSMVRKNEKLVVYFLQFRYSYIALSPFIHNSWKIFNDLKDLNNKQSIQLIERALIKLFLPILNVQHNNGKHLHYDRFVKEKLIANQIKYLHIDVGMNDKLFYFKGGKREDEKDLYYFDLETGMLIKNLPFLSESL